MLPDVYKYCSPTRCSMLSGRLPLHVNQNNDMNNSTSTSGIDLRMTILPQKLKSAGYHTHHVGKAHIGGRSLANMMTSRGFDTSIAAIKGGDHFTQLSGQCSCPCSGNCSGVKGTNTQCVDLWQDSGPASHSNGSFTGYIYTSHAVEIIRQHPKSSPLFLYLAYQCTHAPLEAPTTYETPSHWKNQAVQSRQDFNTMIAALNDGVKNVTEAFKATRLWENLLLVFSADNGGETGSAGNNWPLRGR